MMLGNLDACKNYIRKCMDNNDLHKASHCVDVGLIDEFLPNFLGIETSSKLNISSGMKSLKTKFNTLKDLEPNNLHFVKPKKIKNPAIVQILFSRFIRCYGHNGMFYTSVMRPYYTLIQKVYLKFLTNTFKKEMFIFYHIPMEYPDNTLMFASVIRRWIVDNYLGIIMCLVSVARKSSINRLCSFIIIRYLCDNNILYVIEKVIDKLLFRNWISNINRLKK